MWWAGISCGPNWEPWSTGLREQGEKVSRNLWTGKSRHILALLMTIACASLLVGRYGSSNATRDDVPCGMVTVADFDRVVNTIGVLDAAKSRMIASEVRGDKGKIVYLIPDGSPVKEGDVLVRLDPTPFDEEVTRLKAQVVSLEANLDAVRQLAQWEKNQIGREVSAAQYAVRIAKLAYEKLVKGDGPLKIAQLQGEVEKLEALERNYESYLNELKKLSRRGFKNDMEMAGARARVKELRGKLQTTKKRYLTYRSYVFPAEKETALAKVQQAETELEQAKRGGVFRLAKAMAAVKEAKAKLQAHRNALQSARRELEKTVIRAPSSGIAILYEAFRDGQQRKPRIGDNVWQHQPLLYLPDVSKMIVKTRVREVDLYKVQVGQKCSIRVDAYPTRTYHARVASIGALAERKADNRNGEKYFRVTLVMDDSDSVLRPGMTARSRILVDRVVHALVVPVSAIFTDNGATFCYRRIGDSFRRCRVKLGRQNEDVVEVCSGLHRGERVALVKPGKP